MSVLKTIPVIVLSVLSVALTSNAEPLVFAADGQIDVSTIQLDWQSIIGMAGVTGVLVWYLWYTTSAAFPKIREDFRQEMVLERDHHTNMMDRADERVNKVCLSLDRLSEELHVRPCLVGKKPNEH